MSNNEINSIESLFTLDYLTKTTYSIKCEFQITHLHKNSNSDLLKSGIEMFSATLSDPFNSYNKFIFYKKKNEPELKEGQYLKIYKICPTILNNQNERIFLIK